jgi:hypothetical protein
VSAIVADGRYSAGIYCSHTIATAIVAGLDGLNPKPNARFWCWKVPTVDSHPYTGDLNAIPTPDPAGCGFHPAAAWQRDQNAVVIFPAGAPSRSLQVDFSTSSLSNPAA